MESRLMLRITNDNATTQHEYPVRSAARPLWLPGRWVLVQHRGEKIGDVSEHVGSFGVSET